MITISIGGVDKTSSVVFNSVKKKDNLNQQVDNLTFNIKKYGSLTYKPSLGDEVIMQKDGITIFGGVIVRITEESKAGLILEYTITCNDYSQFLKRKLVTERYLSTTVGAIIADILSTYAPDFTDTNVVGDFPIESFAFNRITVAESLQKLADAISYIWYVDYDKDIHFIPKNSEHAPFDLTDTSGNYIYNSLEIIEDLSQIRNSVLVQGGEATSIATRTEYFTGDGVQESFPLANKFSSVPSVVVGTSAQTVGIDNIDDDGSYDVMWNFNEKSVRFTSGNIASTDFTVEGYYLYPIVVRIPAPTSISEFGVYEFAITDKTIASQDEAVSRAIAELTSYQNELHEGSFRTYEDGLRSGMVIDINSTQRGQAISVLIQNVTTTMRDPIGTSLEYSIRFATLKSIGIIEYLQRQLRSREIIEDDQETLLNYIFTGNDVVNCTDSISAPITTTGPYVYSNDAGTTPQKGRYSFATYA